MKQIETGEVETDPGVEQGAVSQAGCADRHDSRAGDAEILKKPGRGSGRADQGSSPSRKKERERAADQAQGVTAEAEREKAKQQVTT